MVSQHLPHHGGCSVVVLECHCVTVTVECELSTITE